jgi:hypothetical protein
MVSCRRIIGLRVLPQARTNASGTTCFATRAEDRVADAFVRHRREAGTGFDPTAPAFRGP